MMQEQAKSLRGMALPGWRGVAFVAGKVKSWELLTVAPIRGSVSLWVVEDGEGHLSREVREALCPSHGSLADAAPAPNTWQNRSPKNSEPNSNSSTT